jgi:hypothetical protein
MHMRCKSLGPSIKSIVGITKATQRITERLGITAVLRPFRAWTDAIVIGQIKCSQWRA